MNSSTWRPRALSFGRQLWRQTIVEPVATGRLRDLHWPYGLRAVVLTGYAVFALAALTVAGSGLIRAHATLATTPSRLGLPAISQAPLIAALSFGVACFAAAALHAPWWLKGLGLLFTLIVSGVWCVRGPSAAGSIGWTITGVGLLLVLTAFVLLRWRRRFAWWEFVVLWALLGTAMVVGVAEGRYGKVFGTDLNPLLLQQTAATLGFLALPAAMVAGASVAEITVRATIAATAGGERLTGRRWAYVILGLVVGLRAVQIVREILGRDPVAQGWSTLVPAVILVALFALVGLGILRLARRHPATVIVSELPDTLGRVGFGVAAVLIGLLIPVQVIVFAVQVFGFLVPGTLKDFTAVNLTPLVSQLVDPSRALFGLVLIGLGFRAARRGRPGSAIMLGCVGVMLLALARKLLVGDSAVATIDPDAINLVGTLATGLALLVVLSRRRLTRHRALAFTGLLVLSALLSYRDFISDPLGALIGFSGAALVLFGLTWDLLTGAGWGNGSSRRFPREVRVLLVLTNSVLTMTVLAYAALVRDGSTTIYLNPYAEFGDLVFGTALLAAATIAVWADAWHDDPVR